MGEENVGKPDDKVHMAFAGAGNGLFIDKLAEKMWEAANQGPGMTHREILDRVEDANIEWHRRIWEVYGKDSRPEVEILIAIYTPNEINLYKATGPIISSPVESHSFVGIGGELGNYLSELLRSETDRLEEDVSLGLYIIANAKKYVDGCGGDTQLAAMMPDGSIHKMGAWDAAKRAGIVSEIGREIHYLFSVAVDMGSSKKNIDRTARSIVKNIHESRAELCKEVRKIIRVGKSLKDAIRVSYRKVEWPPTMPKP